jgi:8-oxo-dGTP pyrophosphatase MutT (NUDIX family)
MKKFVAVVFTWNGDLILQRRDAGAPNNPNTLGFFGGHVESGENADSAIRRELKEETDLEVPKLEFRHLFDVQIPVADVGGEQGIDSIYTCRLSSPDFTVKEGKGAEIYALNQLIDRKDIAPYSKVILSKLLKEDTLLK